LIVVREDRTSGDDEIGGRFGHPANVCRGPRPE
jgi:hypothetical protein